MVIRLDDNPDGWSSGRMAIRSDWHSFGKDVFVYDGFEVFVVAIKNQRSISTFQVVRSNGHPIGWLFVRIVIHPARLLRENKFTAGLVIRSDGNPLDTSDL
ncbi:hypothetical protein HanPI659440_Chr05g0198301 [Helianthus annuus]|nr:hypothetical protein HanPI659440_Chr05g0198301 [Helianthus annuus]